MLSSITLRMRGIYDLVGDRKTGTSPRECWHGGAGFRIGAPASRLREPPAHIPVPETGFWGQLLVAGPHGVGRIPGRRDGVNPHSCPRNGGLGNVPNSGVWETS